MVTHAKYRSYRQDAPLGKLIRKCEGELQKDDNLLFVSFRLFSRSTQYEKPSLNTKCSLKCLVQSSGHVQALCIVLKTSSGSQLVSSHWSSLYRLLAFLPQDGTGGAVLGKYRVKLAGRIALMRLGKKELDTEEDVPEEVEVILGELIEGLSHPVRRISYSA